jgi:hypothetical protein
MLIPIGQYILTMICCTALLFFVHDFFRRYLKLTIFFSLLVLLSCPLWFANLGDWFLVVKTVLMILSIIIISFTRLSYAMKSPAMSRMRGATPFWLIYTVLISNILVALIPDIEIGNYYNALAGLILCITVPLPPLGWRIDTTPNKKHDLLADLPIVWCLLYTSWWMNFIYDGWPNIFSRGLCLMAVTFIPLIMYKRSDLWLSIRAYTLAFYMLTITFFDYSVPFIDSVVKQDNKVIIIWGVINLMLHVVYILWWFRGGYKRFKEKYSLAAL